jgi:hypothetical protein
MRRFAALSVCALTPVLPLARLLILLAGGEMVVGAVVVAWSFPRSEVSWEGSSGTVESRSDVLRW